MAFSHPTTSLYSSITLSTGGGTAQSATVDARTGAGVMFEVKVTVPSGTQTGSVQFQPYHSPDGSATFYPWGPAILCQNIAVPVAATPGYFDWIAPPEGGEWYVIASSAAGAACTLDGRATVLTPG